MILEIAAAAAVAGGTALVGHLLDYRVLKERHFYDRKWDLNISSGNTDGGGINADIIKRDVPNFVLIKDIYKLPFKDKQFEHVVTSHTMEHVDDPEKFFNELRRVSKNVTILIPPIWDLAAFFWVLEHKWQFLTLSTKHVNKLPPKIKLPYDLVHGALGQRVK
jgi:SAM-dependent methyltransferase